MTYEQSALIPNGESSPPGGPAKTSAWRDVVSAWVAHARDCSGRSFASLPIFGPGGSSWRTSLGFCRRSAPARDSDFAEEGAPILTLFGEEPAAPAGAWNSTGGQWVPSSGRWGNSGMGSPTEFWTLNISESPSSAVASSLSDVLETGPHLLRYCLSPKAARGILRRAALRRGVSLPKTLAAALGTVARSAPY